MQLCNSKKNCVHHTEIIRWCNFVTAKIKHQIHQDIIIHKCNLATARIKYCTHQNPELKLQLSIKLGAVIKQKIFTAIAKQIHRVLERTKPELNKKLKAQLQHTSLNIPKTQSKIEGNLTGSFWAGGWTR